jgi:hypothetical protein
MRIGEFEFSRRELAGSMGDFGTLLPLAIGYIAICGLNPAGLLVMMGVTNIALGLIYRVPMPLQPKKVVAAVAIAQAWSPPMIYSSGVALGALWILLAVSGLIEPLVRWTPRSLVRGIQLGLGITLAWAGLRMMGSWWLLGLVSLAIALFLRENRRLPAALILVLLGLGIMAYRGQLSGTLRWGLSLPPLTLPHWGLVWPAMMAAGLAQIPLTLTNATISTAALIREYFPRRAVGERKLLLNMGIMNVVAPLFGGMPMCHGAGGLAGQYAFGARTGGASIMEGIIEVGLGLFLSSSIVALFRAFPRAIVGAMMVVASVGLARLSLKVRGWDMGFMLLTALLSFATNMALGFAVGLAAYHLWSWFTRRLPHR